MTDQPNLGPSTLPNQIDSPHHAIISEEFGHWIVGGCDNQATGKGLSRRIDDTLRDPFGQESQLFLVNDNATLHPCIRLSYEYQGVGYVGTIEERLTLSAHFRFFNSTHVRLVIYNRTEVLPHGAIFELGPEGLRSIHRAAAGVSIYREPLGDGWVRLGIGFVGGCEVGDIKNIFIYPTAPPTPLVVGTGTYVTGVKLERGIGMTPYEPPEL